MDRFDASAPQFDQFTGVKRRGGIFDNEGIDGPDDEERSARYRFTSLKHGAARRLPFGSRQHSFKALIGKLNKVTRVET